MLRNLQLQKLQNYQFKINVFKTIIFIQESFLTSRKKTDTKFKEIKQFSWQSLPEAWIKPQNLKNDQH